MGGTNVRLIDPDTGLPYRAGGSSGGTDANPTITREKSYTFRGDAQLTDAQLATSSSLPNVPGNATFAYVQNNGSQPARWRGASAAPTSTTGQRIPAGEREFFDGDLTQYRFIREAAGAVLDIAYYG